MGSPGIRAGYCRNGGHPPKEGQFRRVQVGLKETADGNYRVILGIYRGYIGIMEKQMETTI